MAELLDISDDEQEPTVTSETDFKAIPDEEPEVPVQDEVPEKYRGKSPAELVRMHQEAEKALGRTGSEVGELRKVVDSYIQSQTAEKQAAPEPVAEQVDWFDDPDAALEQRINNHPKMKEMEAQRLQSQRQANLATLQQKHPDYREVLSESEFGEWVTASPVRTKLFLAADQQFDSEAADELLSTYKERKALASKTVEADKASRKASVKEASTGGASGSQAPKSTKKYRRADIIKLMNNDPERYALMQDEILQAYAEKRVI